jgi:ketosteroid isomerase-like protein
VPPKNLALILEGYRAFCEGDLTQAFSLLDAGVVWSGPAGKDLHATRPEVEAELVQSFGESFPFELTEVVGGGDHIMLGFRGAGEGAGLKRFFAVVEVEDGKVIGIHQYEDRATALAHINSPAS